MRLEPQKSPARRALEAKTKMPLTQMSDEDVVAYVRNAGDKDTLLIEMALLLRDTIKHLSPVT